MTNVTVIDCSALAAVVFEEERAIDVVPRLRGVRLIAPALLPFELSQVCATKMSRNAGQRGLVLDQFLTALAGLDIELEPVGFDELPVLSERHRLSSYDASYLWLALTHHATLVSLDARLDAAWRSSIGGR